MATRIRLQRHGKKGKAYFHIVAADSRAKRDGKFIEKLGSYNPVSNPATIEINFERTLHWVTVGAEMSDTARAILSYKGILYKSHLIKGVAKGAFSMEDAEKKFELWLESKESRIQAKKDGLQKASANDKAARYKAEMESNEAKKAAIEAKNQPEAVEETVIVEEEVSVSEEISTTEEVTETEPETVVETEPVAEEVAEVEETATEDAEPVAEETVVEEATPVAEEAATEETPSAEAETSTEEAAAE